MRPVWLPFVLALALVPRAAWPQGNPLGPEFRINTFTTNNQRLPTVALDSSGNFVVVWMGAQQDGSGYGVFGQRHTSTGAPLGPEFRANTYTTSDQWFSSLASDSSGNFVVTWQSFGDGAGTGIFAQRFANSGVPLGSEFRVNTSTTLYESDPAVAADSSGNFVVVWQGYDPSGLGVFGQRYASSGAPLGSEFRVNTFTPAFQRDPSVASDSSGNFVVVWAGLVQDGAGYAILGQRYASAGAPLGPEFRVNTYTSNHQLRESVASDPSGNFVVVWMSAGQDGSSYGVFGQRYASTGAPLGSEFRVNTQTPNNQLVPSVASDSSGDFVVVWVSDVQDGSSYGVFGQRYASTGSPVGPEFRVNTYTTQSQRYPAVASSSPGNFVVVWTSDTQDGSNDGIFGQRFRPIVPVELIRFRVE